MKRGDRSDLEKEADRPKYPQPHNISNVAAGNDFLRLIYTLKQHARLKQEAKHGNGRINGYHNGEDYRTAPIKRLPYRN